MISSTHHSWHQILSLAYDQLSKDYREFLESDLNYFPDKNNLFNAFKLPLDKTKYILFGQDPYPRVDSAIGYAFIDGKVKSLFSNKGLSKEVNRATSLRNFIKMLLVCEGRLSSDLSQQKIASLDKSEYITTIFELKDNFEKNGVLLLNMALIFTTKKESKKHIKEWRVFIKALLDQIKDRDIKLILFGNIAKEIKKFDEASNFQKVTMPHPYNISFIHDKNAHSLFASMHLLEHYD